jgi:alpha-beta hydrolase superfamily lysophospholipase
MMGPSIENIRLSDGYLAAVRWWRRTKEKASGTSVPAALYFHGIQSHGGWYEGSGAALASAGYMVLMPDRRGSGLNREQRGHVDSVEAAVGDATDSLNALLKESNQATAHIVGVSWGGKLAVCLAAAAPRQVASLTLIAPGLFPVVDLTAPEKFRVAVSLINHRDKKFDIPLNDPQFFTDNPERVAFVEKDTLMLRQVTAPFLLATRRMDRIVGRLNRSGYRGPVHLMLAGKDRIINNERSREWLKNLAFCPKRLTEYPSAHHTMEFERDTSRFFEDLVSGINQ